MSKPNSPTQDFDNVALSLIAITAAAFILFSLLIITPALIFAFFMAEAYLFMAYRNGSYTFSWSQAKYFGWGLVIFSLLFSFPAVEVLAKFRGFVFIFMEDQVASVVQDFLGLTNMILPKRFAFKNVTGLGLRLYLWMTWPLAALFFFIKIKQGKKPLLMSLTKSIKFPFIFSPGTNKKSKGGNFINIGKYKGRFFNSDFNITYDMLRHHLHILGASGFGKSVCIFHIVADLVRKFRGLMLVDLKADIETVRQVIALAKEAGRLDKLKFFSCANPEISTHYNILKRGNANQLTDRIMSSLIWSEEFYKNESKGLLLKVLIPLVWIRDNTSYKPHLGNLLSAIKTPDYLAELKSMIPPERTNIVAHLEEVDRYLKDKDLYKNLQGLRTQLEAILLTDFGPKLCPSPECKTIDIYEAVKNTEIIYFLLDSRRYSESAKSLGRMILEDLKAASGEIDGTISPTKRQAFNIIIDEFADMASEDFISFLDRARSSGMGTIVAHQEISDLKRISPETADRLMHLTSTTVSFLTKLPGSAEAISGMAGTRTTWKVTEKAQHMYGLNLKSGDISLREVEEFNLHPNELKKLGVGDAVVIAKYPVATSGIVKINPPERLNLAEEEFQTILKSITHEIEEESKMKTYKKEEGQSLTSEAQF